MDEAYPAHTETPRQKKTKNLVISKKNRIFAQPKEKDIDMKYTLVVKQGQDGFLIGQLKEIPAVFTQGLSISELKENIADALELYLEDMREIYQPEGVMINEEEMVFA